MGTFIAVVVALAVLLAAAIRAFKRIGIVKSRVAALHHRYQQQALRIRKLARQTLDLRRKTRSARLRLESLDRDCHQEETRLAEIEGRDRRLIVVDDRKLPADRGWVATVSHARFAEQINSRSHPAAVRSWRNGRRFLVWAPDEKKAYEKIAARYPESRGFVIASIVELGAGQ